MRVVCLLLLGASMVFAADPPPPRLPQPPIPPPQLPVRSYSAWQSIQAPLSRSRGEEPDTIDLPPSGYYAPAGRLPVEPLPDLLDTVKRAPPRPRLDSLSNDAARRSEIDRREYELYLHNGLSDQTYAAASAAEALDAAKNQRDRDLLAAQQAYQSQISQRGVDHVAANNAYVEQTHAIQQQYQRRRMSILGDPPSTQPAR